MQAESPTDRESRILKLRLFGVDVIGSPIPFIWSPPQAGTATRGGSGTGTLKFNRFYKVSRGVQTAIIVNGIFLGTSLRGGHAPCRDFAAKRSGTPKNPLF
jgi:hypothetical protein